MRRYAILLILLLLIHPTPTTAQSSDNNLLGIPAIDNLFDPLSPDYVFRDTLTALSFAIIWIFSLWMMWGIKGDRPTWLAVTFAVIISLLLWLTLKPIILGSLEYIQRTVLNINLPDHPTTPKVSYLLLLAKLQQKSTTNLRRPRKELPE